MHQDFGAVSVGWSLRLPVHHERRFLRFCAGPDWVPEWSPISVLLPTRKPRFKSRATHFVIHGVRWSLSVGWFVGQSLFFFCPCPPAAKIAVYLASFFAPPSQWPRKTYLRFFDKLNVHTKVNRQRFWISSTRATILAINIRTALKCHHSLNLNRSGMIFFF